MIFYCTTLIDNHHKIGISSFLSGVKKRLTTYRSAAPNAKILFFTDVSNAEELERSFKNKFSYQRIGRSECYNLRELTDLPLIDYFNISNKKFELLQTIRRIFITHRRDAFKIINKKVEEFKKKNS